MHPGRGGSMSAAPTARWPTPARAVEAGAAPERPFVLVGQQSLFDPTRGPGREAHRLDLHPCPRRIPRADAGPDRGRRSSVSPPDSGTWCWPPGVTSPPDFEAYNPNYPGGDIGAGAHTLRRMLGRPGPFLNPYRTGIPGVYLCSAAAAARPRRPRNVRRRRRRGRPAGQLRSDVTSTQPLRTG